MGVLKVKDGSGNWVPIGVGTQPERFGGTWRRVAGQSVPANSLTAIAFDTEDEDTHGFGTATSTVITVPAGCGGIYVATWTAYVGIESGVVQISIPNSGGMQPSARANTFNAWATVAYVGRWNAGEGVNVAAWHNAGAAQPVTGRFTFYRISV